MFLKQLFYGLCLLWTSTVFTKMKKYVKEGGETTQRKGRERETERQRDRGTEGEGERERETADRRTGGQADRRRDRCEMWLDG